MINDVLCSGNHTTISSGFGHVNRVVGTEGASYVYYKKNSHIPME